MSQRETTDKEHIEKLYKIIEDEIYELNRRRGGFGNTLPMGGDYQMELLHRIKQKFDILKG